MQSCVYPIWLSINPSRVAECTSLSTHKEGQQLCRGTNEMQSIAGVPISQDWLLVARTQRVTTGKAQPWKECAHRHTFIVPLSYDGNEFSINRIVWNAMHNHFPALLLKWNILLKVIVAQYCVFILRSFKIFSSLSILYSFFFFFCCNELKSQNLYHGKSKVCGN